MFYSVYRCSDVEDPLARPTFLVHGGDLDHDLGILARAQSFDPDLFHIGPGSDESGLAEQLVGKEGRLTRRFVIYRLDRVKLRADQNIVVRGACEVDRGITCVCLILIVGSTALGLALYVRSDFYGFDSMRQVDHLNGSSTIRIFCSEISGYSIGAVDPDAKALRGERYQQINSDLGAYVVKIRLCDADPSVRFMEKYEPWTTYKVRNSELSFMWLSDADHGTEIYIGSDSPIDTNSIEIIGHNYGSGNNEIAG